MFFKNLALPMRAQPFHIGHARYIKQFSKMCNRGLIFLSKEYDLEENPFLYKTREFWINKFLSVENINNILIAKREKKLVDISGKYEEYVNCFDTTDFVVITTNETDNIYKLTGLQTFNHHDPDFVKEIWGKSLGRIKLFSTGRIIRERLKKDLDCSDYLTPLVYKEARMVMQNI